MTTENERFDSLVDDILQTKWRFYPNMASKFGLHEYDGRLPDISIAAISRRASAIERAIERLGRIDIAELARQSYFDHKLLLASLQHELYELTELQIPQTNPIEMQWHVELSNYIIRDYAPLSQRVESLTRALTQVPKVINQLRDGLSRQLSRAVIEASIEAYEGLITFYEKDVPKAISTLDDAGLRESLDAAIHVASEAISGFVEYLRSLESGATNDFAIGAESFEAMLKHGEMVELPLERILEVGLVDLARNLARIRQVASEIDSSKSPQQVMAAVASHHPTNDSLVPETRDMLEKIRRYLIDHDIVTVPSEIRCATTETPSFMRWATAALDMPGPFEMSATEAYYYVTPVEDDWTDEQKEEWLSNLNYAVLENTSIHEAYPGHYVHYLHTKSAPSVVSRVFGAYSFWEGWAHYTEEMMIEEGYAEGNPQLLMGQLSDALLRHCRLVCSIRMHTQGMKVDEATRFFMDNAYLEELPARKETMRGTFDPMYLNYTLGKLMILKLREDYRHEQGNSYSLKKFHDTFLSFGAPPIPLAREMMLRNPGRQVF